jgi:uncharacterized DUF497 family protein
MHLSSSRSREWRIHHLVGHYTHPRLITLYRYRTGDRVIRIISARKASTRESKQYC